MSISNCPFFETPSTNDFFTSLPCFAFVPLFFWTVRLFSTWPRKCTPQRHLTSCHSGSKNLTKLSTLSKIHCMLNSLDRKTRSLSTGRHEAPSQGTSAPTIWPEREKVPEKRNENKIRTSTTTRMATTSLTFLIHSYGTSVSGGYYGTGLARRTILPNQPTAYLSTLSRSTDRNWKRKKKKILSK